MREGMGLAAVPAPTTSSRSLRTSRSGAPVRVSSSLLAHSASGGVTDGTELPRETATVLPPARSGSSLVFPTAAAAALAVVDADDDVGGWGAGEVEEVLVETGLPTLRASVCMKAHRPSGSLGVRRSGGKCPLTVICCRDCALLPCVIAT